MFKGMNFKYKNWKKDYFNKTLSFIFNNNNCRYNDCIKIKTFYSWHYCHELRRELSNCIKEKPKKITLNAVRII